MMTRSSLLLSVPPLLLICLPAVWVLAAADVVPPAHRCQSRCGDVDIPYPFGIGDQCAIHSGFNLNCTRLADGTYRPFNGPFEVTNISVPDAKAWMKMNISRRCYEVNQTKASTWWYWYQFTDTPFRFSYEDNRIYVIGCNTLAYMMSEPYITGCYTTCYGNDDIARNGSCSAGAGCCEMGVPNNLGYFEAYFNENNITSGCGYIVVMEKKAFSYSTTYRSSSSFWNAYNGTVPVVMDWRIRPYTCEVAKLNSSSYACVSNNSQCVNTTNGPGYRCKCLDGYQGNPYDKHGCTDIDECLHDNMNNCTARGATTCQNTQGGYTCSCPPGKTMVNDMCMENQKSSSWVIPVVGASVGLVALVVTITCACLILQRRKLQHIKQRYFQQHGGMLLFEEIKSQQGSSIAFKIFSETELQEATDKFDEKRVLGQGGHGTVYKGLLKGNV